MIENGILLSELLHIDGRQKFISKIIEELAELQVAVLHMEQKKVSTDSVYGEISDVMIQLEKLVILLKVDGNLDAEKEIQKKYKNTLNFLGDYVTGKKWNSES